mmetsp:Transcript_77468/g.239949  ORF Transcript_77468/g.239949 Transcript_77468/m.239949 type:complete len:207 (+) Transcript_77468:382-1002(+)
MRPEMDEASHVTMPSLFSIALMATRMENHVKVLQAPFSATQSAHVTVPQSRSTQRPMSAVTTGGIPKKPAPAQSVTMPTRVQPITISSRLMGPMSFSFCLAACGASGVFWTSGGRTLKATSGVNAMATSAGTHVATSHVLKGLGISKPSWEARRSTNMFWAAPVSHKEEEFPVAWKALCTRKRPVLFSVPRAGSEPLAFATELAMG